MFSPGCWPPRRADEMRQSGWRVFSFHRRHGAFSPLFFIVPTHPIFLYDTHTPQNALYNACLYSHVIDKHLFIDGRPLALDNIVYTLIRSILSIKEIAHNIRNIEATYCRNMRLHYHLIGVIKLMPCGGAELVVDAYTARAYQVRTL